MSLVNQVTVDPTGVGTCLDYSSILAHGTAELGAYMAAVQQQFGRQAAEKAGSRWVDLLEQTWAPDGDVREGFRRITIHAASYLAKQDSPEQQSASH
jgi:hypothetical protein